MSRTNAFGRHAGLLIIGMAALGAAACGGGKGRAPAPTPTPTPCPLPFPFCGTDFPLNTVMTTEYGPAWADIFLSADNYLPCFGPYALCYYANCTVDAYGNASCPCYEWFGPNFVDINAILNLDSYQATVAKCSTPGACQEPNSAPVCKDIIDGSFWPAANRFSTFSFYRAKQEPIGSTDCSDQPDRSPYAGCMTAPCFGEATPGPTPGMMVIDCDCPRYDGPYQIGKDMDPALCDDAPMSWSGAYAPNYTPGPVSPCDMVPGGCIPDAPPDECGCPLYYSGQVLPPDSGVDCDVVCQEYDGCLREGEIELGYTCDATLCTSQLHSLVFDACLGLQNCPLGEIFKAESAAGCSCCASQLCGCEPNGATNLKIGQLNAAQRTAGETPQCDINGTLCGTTP